MFKYSSVSFRVFRGKMGFLEVANRYNSRSNEGQPVFL